MLHVVGLSWENFRPSLTCRTMDLQLQQIDLSPGQILNLKLHSKECIGPDLSTVCPHHSEAIPACPSCSLSGHYPCIRCDGSVCINTTRRMRCAQGTYAVYLASFGDKIKVGVSSRGRLMQRWLEQGAEFACELAVLTDGMKARKMENGIGRLGVRKAISYAHKMDSKPDRRFIDAAIQKLTSRFSWLKTDPQVYELSSFYPHLPRLPLEICDLVGQSGGVRGHLLLLENKVIDLKKLLGWRVSN